MSDNQQGAKKAKRTASADLGVIALGTSTGAIVVWDLEKGKVAQRLTRENTEQGHGSAVHDVVFTANGSSIYSCASEKHVLEWNLKDGAMLRKIRVGSEGASKLALSVNDEVLAVGNNSIKLFDVVSGKKCKKFKFGHASSVAHLIFSTCGRYVFSASHERFINVFDSAAENSRSDEPLFSCRADSTLLSITAYVHEVKKGNENNIHATAILTGVTDTGIAYIWSHGMQPTSKPVAAVSTITSTAPVVLSVFSGCSRSTSFLTPPPISLLVARGSIHKPHFETVVFVQENKNGEGGTCAFLPRLSLAALDTSMVVDNTNDARCLKKNKTTDGSLHVPTLIERGGSVKASTMADETSCAAGMTDGGGGSDDEMDDDEENDDEGDDDVTLEERVQAMQDALKNEGQNGDDDEEEDCSSNAHNIGYMDKYSKSTTRSRAQASSASLVTVLEQALQTKDNLLLENALRIYDVKVIDETCRRLSPTKVFAFLFLLVEKFERRPMRGANLCVWIKFLLMNHTAYLMTAPHVIQKLSTLYQSFDARLKVFPQLHKLNGRLNLVLGQIAGRANAKSVDETPQVVYHEEDENGKGDDDDDDGEEDEEEMEDEENENDIEEDD